MSSIFPLEVMLKCLAEISDDHAVLKNCALVCSSLQAASQELLFATLDLEVNGTDSHLRIQGLTASPRLVSYIRHLSLKLCLAIDDLDEDECRLWLNSEGNLLLIFLQTVSLDKIRSFSFQDFGEVPDLTFFFNTDPPIAKALFHAMARICASSSLRTLEVASTGSFFLLEVCSPSVQNLFITDLLPDYVGNQTVIPGHPIKALPIRVKNLELDLSRRDCKLIDHLLNPQSRICINGLTHLHVSGYNSHHGDRIQGILDQCRDTLTSLVLCSANTETGKCKISFSKKSKWLKDKLAAFVSEHPSKLQQLVFTYLVSSDIRIPLSWGMADMVPPPMVHWGAISSLLAQDTLFPDLQHVEVLTRCWEERWLGSEHGLHVLSPSFRELYAKGILEIRHMRGWKWLKFGEDAFSHFYQPRIEPSSAIYAG
ncbi:hypothetical protein BKA70DRAFT_1402231 [Coprinopsis sp. MPI-PUGE-AT-0042]|nr:hypothetical protein BKA70DRAFT_1402231 [Coprinopsis sp. MPI-PUGE-AT-0042]